MPFSVAFGQYLSRDTITHALDAKTKIVLLTFYSFALFACSGWIGIGMCTALAVGVYATAHIPPRFAVRSLKPVVAIAVFTVIVHALTFASDEVGATGEHVFIFVDTFGVSAEGALRGLFFACRIGLFMSMSSLLTYSSPLVDIVDGAASLMRPLRKIAVPVEDIAVVLALTLRFIPSTIEEADRIMKAQASRGLVFDRGGVARRAKAWIPVITPLFITLFKRAERLACAMDARCYTGLDRTHLTPQHRCRKTTFTSTICALALVAVGVLL